MGYILTFDVGTTSVKTRLYDERFQVLGAHSAEYSLIVQAGGIVEMDPDEYWLAICKGCRSVIDSCQDARTSIAVIAVTTQGETLIPIDNRGRHLSNAVVWLDSRSTKEAVHLRQAFGTDVYYPVTGLSRIDEAAPISKILNMKNTRPDIYARTSKFLLLEDYILFRLSGQLVTEKSLLSSTGYFDIAQDEFYTEILDYAGIDPGLFPEALDCACRIGTILTSAASDLGIGTGAQVVTCAMDQVAGAVGAGNIRSGIVTETTGTALVMGATTLVPDFSHPAKPIIYRHIHAGMYFVLSLSNTAGIILKWFKDEFCMLESERHGESAYAELGRMAEAVPPGADGLLVFPYFSGMLTPIADASTQGMFYGVTLSTGKAHFVRAIMESVAYMLRENIEIFEQMGIEIKQIRSTGGGSKSRIWSRIKADVLEREIISMKDSESASLGAAILGALGAGLYPDMESIGTPNQPDELFMPDRRNKATYDTGYRKYRRLYQCHLDMTRQE